MRDKTIFGLSILWIVAAGVAVTVLLSLPLFYLDIHWEQLTAVSGFDSATLRHNYNVLMAYELNPFVAQLRMPDFPDSTSGLTHFAEVRRLFTLVNVLAVALIPAFVVFVKEHLYILFRRGMIVAMAVPVLLAGFAATVGFDNFFILFHEALFRDNTWLFDPTVDPIINVLTDNFFLFCFILFGLIYEGIFVILILKGRKK